MRPLNESLFSALRRVFRHVKIAHPGSKMLATYVRDQISGRVRMIVSSPGEYYCISCPFCSDTRFRLWINHRWGVRDRETGTHNRWLAVCFNEDCLKSEENRKALVERLSWYNRSAAAGQVTIQEGHVGDVGKPIKLPQDYVRLDELEDDHPAREYVRGRNFNPDALATIRGVGFSVEAYCLSPLGRLLIPVYRLEGGKPVVWGWQARALDSEPDTSCRYFTSPGLKKSHLLYGLERVPAAGHDPVLICEGPTDVWRAGSNSVALLGHHASQEQIRLILKHLHGRPLVVALDPDAQEEAAKLVDRLRSERSRSLLRRDAMPVVNLLLPDGRDPGDFRRKQLWALASKALERRNPHARS